MGEEKYKAGKFEQAPKLFVDMMIRQACPDFLTIVAYDYID